MKKFLRDNNYKNKTESMNLITWCQIQISNCITPKTIANVVALITTFFLHYTNKHSTKNKVKHFLRRSNRILKWKLSLFSRKKTISSTLWSLWIMFSNACNPNMFTFQVLKWERINVNPYHSLKIHFVILFWFVI